MARWKPEAKHRLEQAALDLFDTRGYDSTTVADIAARAGLTSRTFFRYFADKREVLFANADILRDQIEGALRAAPGEEPPFSAALAAMGTCAPLYAAYDRRRLRQRDDIVAGSSELREREALKLASIATGVAAALVDRGSPPDDARLVADLSVIAFKQAARLWIDDPTTPYHDLLERAAEQARDIIASHHGTTSGVDQPPVAAVPGRSTPA